MTEPTSDTFRSIKAPTEAVFSDKGSKFIAYLFPINQLEDYKECLQKTKSIHPKARHHCWAVRHGKDKNNYKLSDDGEPSGSAGRPILNTLLSADITHVCAIVVRYFGGTLLGVPGLIHAYKTSTLYAIELAEIDLQTINHNYAIRFKYEQMNEVMRIVKETPLHINSQQFDNECEIVFSVRATLADQAYNRLKNIDLLSINQI